MKRKYKARHGGRYNDKDAKVIGKFLQSTFPDGEYTTKEIVELAKSKSSPIHKYFEWNKTRAAHLYNLQQARNMINCVVVEIDGDLKLPTAISVKVKNKRVYMDTEKIMEHPEAMEQVLGDAVREIEYWQEKYSYLKKLKPVLRVMSPALKRIKKNLEKRIPVKRKKSVSSSVHT